MPDFVTIENAKNPYHQRLFVTAIQCVNRFRDLEELDCDIMSLIIFGSLASLSIIDNFVGLLLELSVLILEKLACVEILLLVNLVPIAVWALLL